MIKSNSGKLLKKIVIRAGCFIVILSIIGYFAMDYGVNYFLNSMLTDKLENSSTTLSTKNELQEPNTQENDSSKDEQTSEDKAEEDRVQDNLPTEESTQEGSHISPNVETKDVKVKEAAVKETVKKVDEVVESSQAGGSNDSSVEEASYNGNITEEKAVYAKNEITLKEKTLITSILLKNLSAKDISLFTSMSDDGITVEDKKKAKEIILQKLSAEEYNQLIAIAAKLGLSQGKNYNESLKEFN